MNNLFKSSNSKFVMNLFKSLGVACAVVTVNSCDTNKGNNDNKSEDEKKEEVKRLLEKAGKMAISDKILDRVISSNELRKLMLMVFLKELKMMMI